MNNSVTTNMKLEKAFSLEEKLKVIEDTRSGIVEYGFTNDYMFRAVLQNSPVVLTEIVRILLRIPRDKEVICEITNPILLGKTLESKDCVLDIRVIVNGEVQINMEMQMSIALDWVKRSMYYGFGMYLDLKAGQDYGDCRPSYHFGFVKKSPFKDDDRFFSTYLLRELTTGRIYSGDFQINMINLSKIGNATEEDRESGLYDWVRLFIATEWKELMELARRTEALGNAVVTLAELSTDEKIRQQCDARKKYEMDQNALEKRFQKLTSDLEAKRSQLQEQEIQLQEQESQLQQQANQLQLSALLVKAGRYEDLQRAVTDSDYQKILLEEYGLVRDSEKRK